MRKFKYLWEAVFVATGVATLAANTLFVVKAIPFLYPILNVIGGLTATVPPVLVFYTKYRVNKEIDQQFVIFVKDLSDSIKSGMTLPMALSHCSKRDYLSLTKHVRDISAQVDWGIPFEKTLNTFANRTQSLPVKRAVVTIIATYKVGGKVSDTLDAVNKSLVAIDKIKKQRSASVYSQIVTSYLIFFVFISILIIMQLFLIPSLTQGEVVSFGGTPAVIPTGDIFTGYFINFIVIQGFFAGLATGKMAEASLAAGLKHAIILIAIGYSLFTISLLIFS
jgi:flagellar protein FlaJ